MTTAITQKIIGYKVLSQDEKDNLEIQANEANTIIMHEGISRPEILFGATYKIKPPAAEHALYVTINDMLLNEGTDKELKHPYEIFFNSKNMEHFQWVLALTRVMSAVFRKGGDIGFIVNELKEVFDPKQGGYWKKGKLVPSLVAEIGYVLEAHLIANGVLTKPELSSEQVAYIAEKQAVLNVLPTDEYPANATVCSACNTRAVIVMDGCKTCLACADSKCG